MTRRWWLACLGMLMASCFVGPHVSASKPAATLLSGRVLAGADQPIAGASISWQRPQASSEAPTETVRSGSDGSFRLSLPKGETVDLVVEADGFVPRRFTHWPGAVSGDRLDLVLHRPSGVIGRIQGDDACDLDRAEARLVPVHGVPGTPRLETPAFDQLRVTAGPSGVYRLTYSSTGTYFVQVMSDACPPVASPLLRLEATGEVLEIDDLALLPGARLEGRVVDPDGAPVAGVQVISYRFTGRLFFEPNGLRYRRRAVTDEEGRFFLPGLLEEDRLTLSLSKDGWMAREVGSEASIPSPLEVVLEPASRLVGRVLDTDGRPIRRARIDTKPGPGSQWSDAEGRYEMKGLPRSVVRLVAKAEGYRRFEREGLRLGGPSVPFDIVLEKLPGAEGLSIRGTVRGPSGEPRSGVRVSARRDESSWYGVETGPEGRYTLRGLREGERELNVSGTGLGELFQTVKIHADGQRVDFRFIGHALAGRIVDAAKGEPINGAVIQLQGNDFPAYRRVVTQVDGAFALEALADGRYRLDIQHDSYARQDSGPFEIAGRDLGGIRIELARGASIHGRVIGHESIPSSELVLEAHSLKHRQFTSLEAGGRFRFDYLPSGAWFVRIRDGSGRSVEKVVEIGPDTDRVEIAIEWPHGRSHDP